MSGTSAICGFVTQTTNRINVVRSASAKIYHTHSRSISLDSITRYSYAGYKKAAPSQLVNQAKSLLGNHSLVVRMNLIYVELEIELYGKNGIRSLVTLRNGVE